MLHILLMILKIIGIILAVLLGLILLVILVVLFVPFRYEAKGSGDGTIESISIEAKAGWLLGLVRAVFTFRQKTPGFYIGIAWFKLGEANKKKKKKKSSKKGDTVRVQEDKKESIEKIEEESRQEPDPADSSHEEEGTGGASRQEGEDSDISQTAEAVSDGYRDSEDNLGVYEEESDVSAIPEEESVIAYPDGGSDSRKKKKIGKKKIPDIKGKLSGIADKGIGAAKSAVRTISDLNEKKDHVLDFAENETHVKAFVKLKDVTFRLIRKILPRKIAADLTFGFEDPSITGRILAAIACFYPFAGKNFYVTPDFTKSVFKGDFQIKGHIRVIHFVTAALRLLLCRAVWRTYKDFRSFKL